MIIVNYFREKDCSHLEGEYMLAIAGIINDHFDVNEDPEILKNAIEMDDDLCELKEETLYEIQLIRGAIQGPFPAREPTFVVDRIIEKKFDEDFGWITPEPLL